MIRTIFTLILVIAAFLSGLYMSKYIDVHRFFEDSKSVTDEIKEKSSGVSDVIGDTMKDILKK